MALNIGTLVGYLTMNKDDWNAGKVSAKRDLDDIADEAEKAGKKTDQSTKDAAKKVERNFSAIQFGALFAGLPAAAAVAAVGVAGSLALVSGGFIAMTAVALGSNVQVQESVSRLSTHVEDSVKQMAAPLAGEFTQAIDKVGKEFDKLEPEISAAMRNSAKDVGILTDGVLSLVDQAMPGLVVATNQDTAALQGLSSFLTYTGRGVTDFFVNMSTGSAGAGRDLATFGQITQQLLGWVGQLLANLANNGTASLGAFGAGLSMVEHMMVQLTAAGSPAYSMLGGFLTTVNGGLGVLQLLVSLLSLLPPGLSQFGGSMLAVVKILSIFKVNAFAAFDGLGTKVKEAEGAGGKLKTGLSGLISGALNPMTLAVGAAAVGLGFLGQAQQDAAAKASAHADRVRDLANALRTSSGAIDTNVKSTAEMALQQFNAGDGTRNLLQDVDKLAGPSGIKLLTDGYLGNGDALGQLKTQLQATIDEHYHAASATELLTTKFSDMKIGAGGVVEAQDATGKSAQQLLDIINQEGGTFGEASKYAQDLATASGQAGTATTQLTYAQKLGQQASSDLSKAFQGLGMTENDVATKGKLLQQVLDTLNGRAPSHEQAIQTINDQVRALADEFGKGANKADGWGKSLINADGTVNSTSANGSKLLSTMESLESGFANAGASIDDLVKSGVPLAQAQQQINGELTTARQRFIDTAGAMGLTKQQAVELADKYGLVPTEVQTAILQPGMLDAIRNAGDVKAKVTAIPNAWTVQVNGLTAQAEANLVALGYHVTHLPNGQVWVTAPNAPAVESQLNYVARDRTGHITMIVRQDGSVRMGNNIASANGNLLAPFAGGGIAAYASGGLTPMSSNAATMVPPNTWRVVGDNMRYQELYAPLNGSRRTADLITAAAKHEGLPVGFGGGAVVNNNAPRVQVGAINMQANASPADIAEELDWLSRVGG